MAEETKKETTEEEKPSEEEGKKEEPKALSQEDINKLIEAARKQEKDKLYPTIEELRGQVKDLADAQRREEAEKERIAAEAEARTDQERQAKLSVEDRMSEQLNKFEERLAKGEAERKKLEKQLEEEKVQSELERYTAEVLRNAGDELIPELVRGSTKEEVDNSVAVAKSRFQDLFQAAVKRSEGEPGRKIEDVTNKMPKPAHPDMESIDEEELKGLIPKIDPYASGAGKVSEDYKKNRDKILSQVANAYKGQQ